MRTRTRGVLFVLTLAFLLFWTVIGEPRPGTKQIFVGIMMGIVIIIAGVALTAKTAMMLLRSHRRYRGGELSLAEKPRPLTAEQLLANLADRSHRWYVGFSEALITNAEMNGDALRLWWMGANEEWEIDLSPLLIDGSTEGLIVIWENRAEQEKVGSRYEFVERPAPTGMLVRDDLMLKSVMDTYGS